MRCYANQITTKLLNIASTAPVTTTTEGSAYRVLPGHGDQQTDDAQDFRFVASLTLSGGTTPTAKITIQGSVDGTNWIDLASGAERSAAGTFVEVIEASSVVLLPWVRARVVLTGAPSTYAAVDVISNGPFQLSST